MDVLGRFSAELHAGDGVLDIGGNNGTYAVRFAQVVGPTGHVLCVEPDPDTADAARRQTRDYPQVTVLTCAVGDQPGPAVLHRDCDDSRRNSLWRANVVRSAGESVPVMVRTLDSVAALVRNLRAIKIDAQGAEAAILAGAGDTLANPQLVWLLELWPEGLRQAGSDLASVVEVLRSAGLEPAAGRTWAEIVADGARHRKHSSMDVLCAHPSRGRLA